MKKIVFIFLIFLSSSAYSFCYQINPNQQLEFSLIEGAYSTNNCFNLVTSNQNAKLNIILSNSGGAAFNLRLIDGWNYVSYPSSSDVPIYSTDKNIGENHVKFRLLPGNNYGDKQVKVVSTQRNGEYFLLVHVSQTESSNVSPPGGIGDGGCNPNTGICTDPLSANRDINFSLTKRNISTNRSGQSSISDREGTIIETGDYSGYLGNHPPGDHPACTADNSPPAMPSNVNMNENLSKAIEANARFITLQTVSGVPTNALTVARYWYAYNLFDDGQPLDPKHFSGAVYEDFGNFQYGAFMTLAGFTDAEIFGGAAFNQVGNNGGSYLEMAEAFSTGIGDNPNDTIQIQKGIKYAKEVYVNDENSGQVSDSCDASNGASNNNNNQGGSGGGEGSFNGYDFGFNTGSISYWYSCEVWQFPDGNGGYYYLEKNCVYYMMP